MCAKIKFSLEMSFLRQVSESEELSLEHQMTGNGALRSKEDMDTEGCNTKR